MLLYRRQERREETKQWQKSELFASGWCKLLLFKIRFFVQYGCVRFSFSSVHVGCVHGFVWMFSHWFVRWNDNLVTERSLSLSLSPPLRKIQLLVMNSCLCTINRDGFNNVLAILIHLHRNKRYISSGMEEKLFFYTFSAKICTNLHSVSSAFDDTGNWTQAAMQQ